jgi:hypothetical protein
MPFLNVDFFSFCCYGTVCFDIFIQKSIDYSGGRIRTVCLPRIEAIDVNQAFVSMKECVVSMQNIIKEGK